MSNSAFAFADGHVALISSNVASWVLGFSFDGSLSKRKPQKFFIHKIMSVFQNPSPVLFYQLYYYIYAAISVSPSPSFKKNQFQLTGHVRHVQLRKCQEHNRSIYSRKNQRRIPQVDLCPKTYFESQTVWSAFFWRRPENRSQIGRYVIAFIDYAQLI